ncbi:MAG: hypothetical protein ACREUT_18305 [Steroidobacteraceae bacterium]
MVTRRWTRHPPRYGGCFRRIGWITVTILAVLAALALLADVVGGLLGAKRVGASRLAQAARVGVGTWVGFALTLIARVIIVLTMLVVFVASYLI